MEPDASPTGSTSGRSGRSASRAGSGNYRPDRTAPARRLLGRGAARRRPGHRGRRARVRRAVRRPARSRRSARRSTATRWSVSADGDGRRRVVDAPAAGARRRAGPAGPTASPRRPASAPLRPPPTAWCSWYHYFERVTQADIEENLRRHRRPRPRRRRRADRRRLPGRDRRLAAAVRPVRLAGRHRRPRSAAPAGGPASGSRRSWSGSGRALAARAPRLARRRRRPRAPAGDQQLAALDVTHPGAEAYLREVFGTLPRPRHRLLQDRLHLRRARWRAAAPTPTVAGVDAYRHGPAGHPRGDRRRRLPARLRRADPAERRPGRRDAGRPRHRPPLRARGRRPVAALAAGRRAEQPVAGLAARPVLGQRRRLPGRRPARRAPRGLGRGRRALQRAAGEQRPAARARRVGAGDHPPAAPARAAPPRSCPDRPSRTEDGRALRLQPAGGGGRRAARPAVARAAGGVGGRPDHRDPAARHLPARGALRRRGRRGLRAQGDPRAAGPPRVPAAAPDSGRWASPPSRCSAWSSSRPDDLDAVLVTRFLDYSLVLPGAVRQPARRRT